jgi:hypothetical protein
MKKLIVSKSDSVIVFISNVADIAENGIDVGGLIFPSQSVDVFEVDSIPDGVTVQTHCYTEVDGFVVNPGYNAPKNEMAEQIDELRAQVNPLSPDEAFLSLDVENTDLTTLKAKKIDQLNYLCGQEIYAGFKSSALGSEHTYGFDALDQTNLTGTLTLMNSVPTMSSVTWKTIDSGPLLHTREQFVALCQDSFSHKQSLIAKYWGLKTQVENAVDNNEVISYVW